MEGPLGFLAGLGEGLGCSGRGMLGPVAGAGPVSESESERSISSVFFEGAGGIVGPIEGFDAGRGILGPMACAGPVSESESNKSISSVFFDGAEGIVGPIDGCDGLGELRAGPGALGPNASSSELAFRPISFGLAALDTLFGGDGARSSSSGVRLRLARCGGICGPIDGIL